MTPAFLTIHNWGPFKEKVTFTFPRTPGLYFLTGRNEVNPRMGANACGKSRLWAALCWVIYGKTSTGLKAGDAANWDDGKGAFVEFVYFVDGDPDRACAVRRTWSPNSWTWNDWVGVKIDLAKDEANPLLADLKLNFGSFLSTVLMAQGEDMFLDLKADKKAALFSEVMNLDRWLTYADNASKRASAFDTKCRGLERLVAGLEGQLRSIDDQPLEDMAADWVKRRDQRLLEIERAYAAGLDQEKRASVDLHEAEASETRARKKLNDWVQARSSTDERWRDAREHERDLKTQQHQVLADLRSVSDKMATLEEHDQCPACSQEIGHEFKVEQLRLLTRQATDLEKIQATLAADIRVAAGDTDSHEDAGRKAEAGVKASEGEVRLAEIVVKDIRRAKEALARTLDDLEAEAERLERERNPFDQALKNSADKRDDLARELRQARRKLDDADSQQKLASFWVRGFKEMRLEMIGEALTQLEIEVNNEVASLGLIGWQLRFEVDRETKSGSLQRGFSVFVRSPHNDKPVPWEAWSGGEAQRLRAAAQCGLANLIRGSTGATINLEVWDEPTAGLSPLGISDLLTTLAARAERESRQIWIVDHHSLSFGGFSGQAVVVKTKNGSHFECETPYISDTGAHDARQRNDATTSGRQVLHDLGIGTQPRQRLNR